MKVLVDIPDDKATFGLEVLRNLAFVKKVNPISSEKSLLIEEMKEAVDNLAFVRKGKMKLKSARDL